MVDAKDEATDSATYSQVADGSYAQAGRGTRCVQESEHVRSPKQQPIEADNQGTTAKKTSYAVSKSFIAGGIAGSTAKTCIAPLDRAKILFQTSKRAFSIRAALAVLYDIAREEGFRAMWRGNSATVARVYPYSGIQLMSFDQFKKIVLKLHGKDRTRLRKREKFLCGASAGAVSVMITYPLDLMRAKLAVQRGENRYYKGMIDAFRKVIKQDGILGLYRGLTPTILGILPYAGLSFFTYHQLQQVLSDRTGKKASMIQKMGCGAVAGLVGQSFTYPLDIARRRMQTYTPKGIEDSATNPETRTVPQQMLRMTEILVTVSRNEGIKKGLFKGLSMNWIKGPISVSISFTTFDLLKRFMHIENA
eukprot:gb/GECG01015461.1/.p1 GENE.gb/GECG01015461.1/~~gb/GECG01015461.1/.p1  ORF type:complete len:363 (+),score=31.24 gb/GECG01015461.1/:1-1089(+)